MPRTRRTPEGKIYYHIFNGISAGNIKNTLYEIKNTPKKPRWTWGNSDNRGGEKPTQHNNTTHDYATHNSKQHYSSSKHNIIYHCCCTYYYTSHIIICVTQTRSRHVDLFIRSFLRSATSDCCWCCCYSKESSTGLEVPNRHPKPLSLGREGRARVRLWDR